jgi:hypothetical protein
VRNPQSSGSAAKGATLRFRSRPAPRPSFDRASALAAPADHLSTTVPR